MKVIIVSGPTATGKTNIAIKLAEKFGGEIVNFDSLLLYKEITIGTAKPDIAERRNIPHHMLDVRSILNPMNAADYAWEALPIIEKILSENRLVYLVGGSGFYLQALLKGMYDSQTTPLEITARSNKLYENEGITPFLDDLRINDPKSYKRYHSNDHYRIRRAVEHFWTTGSPLSEARLKKDQSNEELNQPTIHNWDLLHIYLDLPKDEHLEIIKDRTEKMIQNGLIDEVTNLMAKNFSGEEKPLQSIGYKETLDFLSGRFKDIEEYKERIVISTRQLAKSQRTWFKKDTFKKKYHPLREISEIFLLVDEFIKKTKDQV